jgi:hypothetical protein
MLRKLITDPAGGTGKVAQRVVHDRRTMRVVERTLTLDECSAEGFEPYREPCFYDVLENELLAAKRHRPRFQTSSRYVTSDAAVFTAAATLFFILAQTPDRLFSLRATCVPSSHGHPGGSLAGSRAAYPLSLALSPYNPAHSHGSQPRHPPRPV